MKKIGLVGYGYFGKHIARNLYNLNILGGICDLSDKNLEYAKSNYSDIFLTKDLKEFYRREDIIGVIIATPPETHFRLARMALNYNKHCLVEKPMTLSPDSGKMLIELAEKKEKVLMVDHTFLYTGAIRKIKDIINSGELGELCYYKSERANLGLIQKNVNVCWDLITHDIYIIEYLFNSKIKKVFAASKAYNSNQEDVAEVVFYLENGITAYVHVSWLFPYKSREIIVAGKNKILAYDDIQKENKITIYDKKVSIVDNSIQYIDNGQNNPAIDSEEALKLECQHFYHCCLGDSTPIINGYDGLRTVQILRAIDKSVKYQRIISI